MSEQPDKRPIQDRGAKLISASIMSVAGAITLAIGEAGSARTGGLAFGLGLLLLVFGFSAWITTWFRRFE